MCACVCVRVRVRVRVRVGVHVCVTAGTGLDIYPVRLCLLRDWTNGRVSVGSRAEAIMSVSAG